MEEARHRTAAAETLDATRAEARAEAGRDRSEPAAAQDRAGAAIADQARTEATAQTKIANLTEQLTAAITTAKERTCGTFPPSGRLWLASTQDILVDEGLLWVNGLAQPQPTSDVVLHPVLGMTPSA